MIDSIRADGVNHVPVFQKFEFHRRTRERIDRHGSKITRNEILDYGRKAITVVSSKVFDREGSPRRPSPGFSCCKPLQNASQRREKESRDQLWRKPTRSFRCRVQHRFKLMQSFRTLSPGQVNGSFHNLQGKTPVGRAYPHHVKYPEYPPNRKMDAQVPPQDVLNSLKPFRVLLQKGRGSLTGIRGKYFRAADGETIPAISEIRKS
jgi:hypothetical protein